MPYNPFDPSSFDPDAMRRQAFNNALAEMGRNLVQAGMPSPRPVGFGSALGMGIGGFNTGMEAGQDQAVKRYLLSMEIQKKRQEAAAAAQKEKSLAILRGGPPAVVSESPGGERTAQYDPNDPSFRGAMFDVAPEQAVTGMLKPPPESLARIAAEYAARNAWRPPPGPPSTVTTNEGVFARNLNGTLGQKLGAAAPRWQPERPPIVTNPITGESGLVNRGTATIQPLTIQGGKDVSKTDAATATASIRNSLSTIDEVSNSLDLLARNPSATGVQGYIVENVGGLLSQITGGQMDLGAAENQTVRTNLQAMLGRMIPQITNDTSGRYSEGDMQRAQAAVQATKPQASVGQIMSALKEIQDIAKRQVMRDVGKLRSDIPEGSVRALLDNPGMHDQFDEKYGAGAAKTVLGR